MQREMLQNGMHLVYHKNVLIMLSNPLIISHHIYKECDSFIDAQDIMYNVMCNAISAGRVPVTCIKRYFTWSPSLQTGFPLNFLANNQLH